MAHFHTMNHREGCGHDGAFIGTDWSWDEAKITTGAEVNFAWDAEYHGTTTDEQREAIDDRYLGPHSGISYMPEPSGVGPYNAASIVIPAPADSIGGAGHVYVIWACEDDDCEHLAQYNAD